ncbi:MAG: hypothetical protein PW734_01480 [Verrucomicrobium sp.]|nr:hypothetical protein [Verrucomicrobium sp.]
MTTYTAYTPSDLETVAVSPQARTTAKVMGWLCFVGGFASIIASILFWYNSGGLSADPIAMAHGERFGIFIGLWAPTFFILSNRFDRSAHSPTGL